MQSTSNNSNTPSTGTQQKLHPALWIAAIAATAFSLTGIAYFAGWLPHAEAPVASKTAEAPAAPPTVSVTQAVTLPTATTVPANPAAGASEHAGKPAAALKPSKPATNAANSSAKQPAPATAPSALPQKPATTPATLVCMDCGSIETIREIPVEGKGSGIGAVAGGLVGGVIGNQIGSGRGRDAARLAGIAGGAYAGHQIEKNQNKTVRYEIVVRFEDGTSGVYNQDQAPSWRIGDRVKIVNGTIVAN